MRSLPNLLSYPEISFIKKFFDTIDFAISKELDNSEVAYEEFLTPTLGRLLDSRSPFQAILSYSLKDLNKDLAECGSGNKVLLEFETHEHAKGFSGKVSHADLGIVLSMDNPFSGKIIEKAILVESKRLYPFKKTYSFHSQYSAFKKDQFNFLFDIARKYGWNGVYYFLYNPTLESFDDKSRQIIGAIENLQYSDNNSLNPNIVDPHYAEELFYLARKGRYILPISQQKVNLDEYEAKNQMIKQTSTQPGLKVLSVSSIKDIVGKSTKLNLSSCYNYSRNKNWYGTSGAVPFVSLSTFIVDFFISCFRGSTNDEIKNIAEGRSPDSPNSPDDDSGSFDTILAKHTIRIKVESTLPEMGDFFQH